MGPTCNKTAIKKVEALAEKYILLDSLLFKIVLNTNKEATVLAILEVCTDKIITLHYSSLFTGHQRVIKTYLTISNKFFIPNLIRYLHLYIHSTLPIMKKNMWRFCFVIGGFSLRAMYL